MPSASGDSNNPGPDSWRTLLEKIYKIPSGRYSTTGYNKMNYWPFDLMPTGQYSTSGGYISERTTKGSWWSMTGSGKYGYLSGNAYESGGGFTTQDNYTNRGFGLAIRCVVRS